MAGVMGIHVESDSDDEVLEQMFVRMRKERKMRIRPNHFEDCDEIEFFVRFRLRKHTVLHLLELVNDQLEHMTDRNDSVSPMTQLLLTLRYLACGDMILSIADFCGIDKGTASRIIKRVSEAIARLGPLYIQLPHSREELMKVQQNFYKVAAFPRVVGVMDCTHIRIKSPGGENAEDYRCRKGYFSMNVQTVCDSNLKITDIVARWPGATHDQTIFNNSALKARFERGLFPNSVLLCDSGYASTWYLLTPINRPMTRAENLYNESLVRTRNTVERSYGVWKRRFPVLAIGIQLKLDRVEAVVIACAVLHNLAIEMNDEVPPLGENEERINAAIAAAQQDNDPLTDALEHVGVRNNFIQYFDSLL